MANDIHPTAILEGDITLGDGNWIGPYCVLRGPLALGDDNRIGPHVVVGTPGQDTRNPRYDDARCRVHLGSRNIVREFTAIQKPCYGDVTSIGDDVHLMQGVHVPHDAVLEDKVVITPNVALAGLTTIMEGANLAMGCTVHQRSVVGPYAIVAMGAPVLKNVRPFVRMIPGKPATVNAYAVEKFGFSDVADEIAAYVLRDQRPTDPRLVALVERFERLHLASGRAIHG